MTKLLKLGGSLITDKKTAHTARFDVIRRLALEIRSVWDDTNEALIIGHGSGSFGHIPAKQYSTRAGVHSYEDWKGFAKVHNEATALNQIVTEIFTEAGLPVLSFVPMSSVKCTDGHITFWDVSIFEHCFQNHLIPIVFGDTVFDDIRGGTILSTEDIFLFLCNSMKDPPSIFLAGLEDGVWKDYPQNKVLTRFIPANSSNDLDYIKTSAAPDVTGGMAEKVRLMRKIIIEGKAKSALIFSGEKQENLKRALSGEIIGTMIK